MLNQFMSAQNEQHTPLDAVQLFALIDIDDQLELSINVMIDSPGCLAGDGAVQLNEFVSAFD